MSVATGAGHGPQITGVTENDFVLGDIGITHEAGFLRLRGCCDGSDKRERAEENQFHGAALRALGQSGCGCEIHEAPYSGPALGRPDRVQRTAEFYHCSAALIIDAPNDIRSSQARCFAQREV
jgi:hypothetical protein